MEARGQILGVAMSDVAQQMRGPVGGTTDARKVAIGSSVGAVIETYDFIGFGTAAALYFGTAFFPSANPLTGTLAAFATLGVGFLPVRSAGSSAGTSVTGSVASPSWWPH